MAPNQPDWYGLFAVAQAQSGYFTTAQAAQSGYSLPLLQKYLATGKMVCVLRGVHRIVHFPASEHEDFIVLGLWAEQAEAFSPEAPLSLHDLSDALPGRVHRTAPPSWRQRRLRVPAGLVPHFADVAGVDRASHSAVPVTAPLRTLRDCIVANVAADLVQQGILQAHRLGIVSAKDEARPLAELGGRGKTRAAR